MSRHGDIIEVRADDTVLGQFVFYPKAGESNTFDYGGLRTEDDNTGVAGNGEPIWKVSRMLGMLEFTAVNQNNETALQDASNIASGSGVTTWTVTLSNATAYQGVGRIVGDVQVGTDTGLFTLKVNGTWTKIA